MDHLLPVERKIMQSRFWVASYPEYGAAHDAKEALQVLNENRVYQVRRGRDKNHKETFRVVERLPSTEAKSLNGITQAVQPRKGPGKRRVRRLSNPIL